MSQAPVQSGLVRVTVASGTRKFEVDVDWLTGRVAILD